MSGLPGRPGHPVVGRAVPHESAALHVTGRALYTDDLVAPHHGVLHAYPVQVAAGARPGHPARREPRATTCRAWCGC